MHFETTGQGAGLSQRRLSGKHRLPSSQVIPCKRLINASSCLIQFSVCITQNTNNCIYHNRLQKVAI